MASLISGSVSVAIVACWRQMFPVGVCEMAAPYMLGAVIVFAICLAASGIFARYGYNRFQRCGSDVEILLNMQEGSKET